MVYRAFVKNLKLAQETAFKKKKKVEVIWRGFHDVVEPTGPEFTAQELRQRLYIALKEILKIHDLSSFPEGEEKVTIVKKIIKKPIFVIKTISHRFFKVFPKKIPRMFLQKWSVLPKKVLCLNLGLLAGMMNPNLDHQDRQSDDHALVKKSRKSKMNKRMNTR